jgi:hypothetical protein
MHRTCFDKFEDKICSALSKIVRSRGNKRGWTEKQVGT